MTVIIIFQSSTIRVQFKCFEHPNDKSIFFNENLKKALLQITTHNRVTKHFSVVKNKKWSFVKLEALAGHD